MRKVLYVVPYFYDEIDESYPVKYLNDLQCSFAVRVQRTEADGHTPVDGDVEVQATAEVHDIIRAYPDVSVIRDPA